MLLQTSLYETLMFLMFLTSGGGSDFNVVAEVRLHCGAVGHSATVKSSASDSETAYTTTLCIWQEVFDSVPHS